MAMIFPTQKKSFHFGQYLVRRRAQRKKKDEFSSRFLSIRKFMTTFRIPEKKKRFNFAEYLLLNTLSAMICV